MGRARDHRDADSAVRHGPRGDRRAFRRLSIFSGTDRFLGFMFGAARGAVLLGVFVIVAQLLHLDGESWWRHSMLLPYGKQIAGGLRMLAGAGRS